MKAATLLRDCLYLSWAIPRDQLPAPPESLEYELHLPRDQPEGTRYAFASAVLFRQQWQTLSVLPLPKLSHPQANVRLYVQDPDGVPSVLFRKMLVPAWMVPAIWPSGHPAAAASFDFPTSTGPGGEEAWRWEVKAGEELRVEARLGSPPGGSTFFGSWEAAVAYFQHRPRGYSATPWGLRRVDASHARIDPVPLVAEVRATGLVAAALGLEALPPLYSAFLCPEMAMSFELFPERTLAAFERAVAATDSARVAGAAPASSRTAA